jgi:hypothetical protein
VRCSTGGNIIEQQIGSTDEEQLNCAEEGNAMGTGRLSGARRSSHRMREQAMAPQVQEDFRPAENPTKAKRGEQTE